MLDLQFEIMGLSLSEKVAASAPAALDQVAVDTSHRNGTVGVDKTVEVMEEVARRRRLIIASPAWKRAYSKMKGQSEIHG